MKTKTYIDLIKFIKNLDSNQFTKWYMNTIQYGSDLIDENKIIKQIIKSSTADRYFKLFGHFNSYEPEESYLHHELLSLIIEDSDYFVKKCKEELVEKISKQAKLFEMTIDIIPEITTNELRETFRLIIKKISSHTYTTQVYISGTNQLTDYTGTKYKFEICEVLQIKSYEEIIKPKAIFIVEANEDNEYFGLEFEGAGMENFHFDNASIDISKYIG